MSQKYSRTRAQAVSNMGPPVDSVSSLDITIGDVSVILWTRCWVYGHMCAAVWDTGPAMGHLLTCSSMGRQAGYREQPPPGPPLPAQHPFSATLQICSNLTSAQKNAKKRVKQGSDGAEISPTDRFRVKRQLGGVKSCMCMEFSLLRPGFVASCLQGLQGGSRVRWWHDD